MGSSYRSKSTHMVDIKGKGILYEDDDEPIKLTDHDISQNIDEFKLSLIGKILNPKKQSVEKLLQKMPGPFHFNFCMFVLVRWEPIVHDDYPWIIPFWTRLIGVPLHLWTENNLKEIGSRLGHVHQDTIELIEGRMLLDIDSRRPLKFARKAESPDGDEVTIEIKYEMLFKHCSTCGMLTHEKEYCPSFHRQGVFARLSRYDGARYDNGGRSYDMEHSREAYKGHGDRITRRRDEPSRRMRYGGARSGTKPYDRYNRVTWRERKQQPQPQRSVSPPPRTNDKRAQSEREASPLQSQARTSPDQRSLGVAVVTRRIASAIVTPSRSDHSLDGNVTKRLKGTPRSLAFNSLTEQDPKPAMEDDQVIEALNDMDITEQLDGGMMDCEMQNDDLLGLELAEMEDKTGQVRADYVADKKTQKLADKSSRHTKHGSKSSASLGIQKKKFEILLRGSPHKRSTSSLTARAQGGAGGSRRHHHRLFAVGMNRLGGCDMVERDLEQSLMIGDGSYGHPRRSVSPPPRTSDKRAQSEREASPLQSQARTSPDQRSLGVAVVTRRIASAIFTPSRSDHSLDGNVTKRLKGTPRSLAFNSLTEQDPKPAMEDDQVIEALNDMDITEQLDGGMMDCEMQNDDLLGLELAEMEDKTGQVRADYVADKKTQKLADKSSRHTKHGWSWRLKTPPP
uniref:Zinc knuckle CX2CX4HX4C domain-containing protein n=1 Tax=Brassica oleracea var. oleracea TaxID=109376 RepID=A0A0D3A928_BRAOL